MKQIALSRPEYLILQILAEMERPIEFEGDAAPNLIALGSVDNYESGIKINNRGRRRANAPFELSKSVA